jgi:hypothetical protein
VIPDTVAGVAAGWLVVSPVVDMPWPPLVEPCLLVADQDIVIWFRQEGMYGGSQ